MDDFEKLNVLMTIWIVASNDENHLITYRGLTFRLGLKDPELAKNIVYEHRELFRTTGGGKLLESWKSEMLQGKQLPSWLWNIEEEQQRKAVITSLTTDNIFRSQFRCENHQRSPIEIIDWGIKHIDRLREIRVNAKEKRFKLLVTYAVPVVSSLIAIASLLLSWNVQNSTILIQKASQSAQIYQVQLKPKLDKYTSVISGLDAELAAASNKNVERVDTLQRQIQMAFLNLEPFFDYATKSSMGIKLSNQLMILNNAANFISRHHLPVNEQLQKQREFMALFNKFKTQLRDELFKEKAQ